MEPFTRVTGVLAPLDRANVDTDQIIPKQFLKRIERSGYGPFLFYDWRREGNFILDKPEYQGAAVLVTGGNFGCGSSREHAAWSLLEAGFRAVIAPSFGDIFKSNSFRSGLLPVELPELQVAELIRLATEEPGMEVTVDLAARRHSRPSRSMSSTARASSTAGMRSHSPSAGEATLLAMSRSDRAGYQRAAKRTQPSDPDFESDSRCAAAVAGASFAPSRPEYLAGYRPPPQATTRMSLTT
jgi:3-isopropylmalate/(R)-2-methylmalate dehydratase small subunit